METRNKLLWSPSKNIRYDGRDCRIKVEVSLDDDCKNMHHDFSITSTIVLRNPRNMRDPCVGGGCNHETIGKYFPELKKFFPLHLATYEGYPTCPVENGMYFVREKGVKTAMEQMRITSDEVLRLAMAGDDKLYFKYLLYKLGIVARWKKEADEFIAFLEEKCGYKWVNPYKPAEERHRLEFTDEERKLIEERIAEGYYSQEQIEARNKSAADAARQKLYDDVNAEYDKATEKARKERDVKLYLLDCGMSLDNVIYYQHSNKVCFNWKNYVERISQEDFVDFVNQVDYSRLPEGIEFEIK